MMFRKMTIGLIVAVVAVLVMAVAVSAQGRGQGAGFNRDGNGVGVMTMRGGQRMNDGMWNGMGTEPLMQQRFLNRTGDGTCANFVDEDGDGICDNAGQQLGNAPMNRAQMTDRQTGVVGRSVQGRGMGNNGFRSGTEPLHRFGDGICDHETPPRDGTGSQNGRQNGTSE